MKKLRALTSLVAIGVATTFAVGLVTVPAPAQAAKKAAKKAAREKAKAAAKA